LIIDITNEVYTKLKSTVTSATILTEYPESTPVFPCVVFSELLNNTYEETIDTGGQNHGDVSFEVQIFSNSDTKITQVKSIRNSIDSVMADTYGMSRTYSNAVPNYMDTNIYRYVLRYTCIVDANRKIYGR